MSERLSGVVHTSADSYTTLSKAIKPFEAPHPGYRILSIGEGPSDFVARLLQDGYDATAADYDYDYGVQSCAESTRKIMLKNKPKDFRNSVAAIKHFLDASRNFPGRYVAARGDELPFAGGLFEAVRVTKPGGLIEIVPYLTNPEYLTYEEQLEKSLQQSMAIPALLNSGFVESATLSESPWRGNDAIQLTVKKKSSVN